MKFGVLLRYAGVFLGSVNAPPGEVGYVYILPGENLNKLRNEYFPPIVVDTFAKCLLCKRVRLRSSAKLPVSKFFSAAGSEAGRELQSSYDPFQQP